MGKHRNVEIICSACGDEALLVRTPQYDGLKKVGEALTCSSCGHEFASEEDVPFKASAKPTVFTDADRPEKIEVFEDKERERLCRYCANYVINPFMQWCAHHKKEVEATDTCAAFERRAEEEDEEAAEGGA